LGVALGGGGARGFAHLGVFLALDRAGLPIDAIAGTSLGAAMGAARALALDLGFFRRILTCLDLNSLLQVSSSTPREVQRAIGRGMIEYVRGSSWRSADRPAPSTERMRELFSLLTAGRSFRDATIPFAAVAADLETGDRLVLREGKLCDALAASAAVPGVFPPVAWNGRFLIDGGIVDKIPADVTIDLGADVVIAVDTGAPLSRAVRTSFDALLQSERITSRHLTRLQLREAARRIDDRLILVAPPVGWMTMFAFEHLDAAVAAGETAAEAQIPAIREQLRRRRAFTGRWPSRRLPHTPSS
jgi:NTE family protein